MRTVQLLVAALIVLSTYEALVLTYLSAPDFRRMDFFDLSRRLGKILTYLTLAWAALALVLRIAPEWRLPPVVIAVLMTTVGATRDVIRERKKRKGSRHG
jgi:hypothetical protein